MNPGFGLVCLAYLLLESSPSLSTKPDQTNKTLLNSRVFNELTCLGGRPNRKVNPGPQKVMHAATGQAGRSMFGAVGAVNAAVSCASDARQEFPLRPKKKKDFQLIQTSPQSDWSALIFPRCQFAWCSSKCSRDSLHIPTVSAHAYWLGQNLLQALMSNRASDRMTLMYFLYKPVMFYEHFSCTFTHSHSHSQIE